MFEKVRLALLEMFDQDAFHGQSTVKNVDLEKTESKLLKAMKITVTNQMKQSNDNTKKILNVVGYVDAKNTAQLKKISDKVGESTKTVTTLMETKFLNSDVAATKNHNETINELNALKTNFYEFKKQQEQAFKVLVNLACQKEQKVIEAIKEPELVSKLIWEGRGLFALGKPIYQVRKLVYSRQNRYKIAQQRDETADSFFFLIIFVF